MMFGYIILRDIPKEAAQLDLSIFEIQGGFRGFAEVLPGAHYISIKVGEEMHPGFWCYLEPGDVVVKVFDYDSKEFINDEPETEAHFRALALSRAMNKALIPIFQRDPEFATLWTTLVSKITADNLPPVLTLHHEMMEEGSDKKRFEQALYETHHGDIGSFLAEFQYAFVKSVIKDDDNARERWVHLLQAVYHAGERGIERAPALFPALIDTIIAQFKYLPDDAFGPNSALAYGAGYLAEDMVDTGLEGVVEKGEAFWSYMQTRLGE